MKKFILILTVISLLLPSCTASDPVDTADTSKTDGTTASTDTVAEDTDVQTQDAAMESETDDEITEPETDDETTEPETEKPWEVPEAEYLTDISKYEKYIDPEDRDAYLILVNHNNRIDRNYVPDDLIDVVDTTEWRSTLQMRLYAAKALEAFLKEARAAGCKNVTAASCYRSYDRQEHIFNRYVNDKMKEDPSLTREEAEAIIHMDTAFPGESEHQTGLACDVENFNQTFGDTFEGKWLAKNAWKFGFILRFPEDKEEITKIVYEPWHFRYVGRSHAKYMYDNNLCLEEYIEYLNN